jgi:hypothetical protein
MKIGLTRATLTGRSCRLFTGGVQIFKRNFHERLRLPAMPVFKLINCQKLRKKPCFLFLNKNAGANKKKM